MSAAPPEPAEGPATHTELPHFLKRGYPDIGLPPAKCRPGTMRFPEARAPREAWGHDGAGGGEWAVREWLWLGVSGVRPGHPAGRGPENRARRVAHAGR